MKASVCLLLIAAAVACSEGGGGGDQTRDASAPDAAIKLDAGVVPEPDRDSDGVPDARDNCVGSPNVDQLDEDNDGIGDRCDRCVATPFSPTASCTSVEELEPNDTAEEAQPINFTAADRLIEIRGTLEGPDRFLLTIPDLGQNSFFIGHLRLAPRPGSAPFEPYFEVELVTAPDTAREARGELVAERDVIFVQSDPPRRTTSYEVRVGGKHVEDVEYALAIELRVFTLHSDAEELNPIVPQASFVATYTLSPPGSIKFLYVQLRNTPGLPNGPVLVELTATSTAGIEPIAVVPLKSSIFVQGEGAITVESQRFVLALDHRRIDGSNLDVTVSLRHNADYELEPNNTLATAGEVVPLGTIWGRMDAPAPDEDWVTFRSGAGEVIEVDCVNAEMIGDVQLELYAIEADPPRLITLRKNARPPRDPVIRYLNPGPETRYAYRVTSELANDFWIDPDLWYSCTTSSNPLDRELPPSGRLTATGTITDSFFLTPSRLLRWDLEVFAPAQLTITTATTSAVSDPYLRLYGPNGRTIFGEGLRTLDLELAAEPEPYVLIIENANDGSHDPTAFTLDVTMTPR